MINLKSLFACTRQIHIFSLSSLFSVIKDWILAADSDGLNNQFPYLRNT